MSNHWWRAYDDAVDHAKLLLLTDVQHRAWFNLMCLASANDGALPEMKVVALKLRMKPARVEELLSELREAELMDSDTPHNWHKRQFKSDHDKAEKQKRYRDRGALRNAEVTDEVTSNVTGDQDVTAQRQSTERQKQKQKQLHVSSQPIDSSNNLSFLGEGRREAKKPPKHCQTDKKGHIYIVKGTPEWDAYVQDFKDATGEEPTATDNGRWFDTLGKGFNGKQNHATKLRSDGAAIRSGDGRNGMAGHQEKHPGGERVDAVLQRSSERDAVGVSRAANGADRGDDSAGAVAATVRSELPERTFTSANLITVAKPKVL